MSAVDASSASAGGEPMGSLAAPARWAARLAQAQGVVLVGVAVAFVGWLLAARPDEIGLPATSAVVIAVLGVGLFVAGRGLAAGSSAALAPATVIELLHLPVAWSLCQAHQWFLGPLVGVPALAVIVVLFGPAGRGLRRG